MACQIAQLSQIFGPQFLPFYPICSLVVGYLWTHDEPICGALVFAYQDTFGFYY